MVLKPQDIVVMLKFVAMGNKNWSFASLADELYMSPSEVHAGVKRATAAKLFDQFSNKPNKNSLEEFIIHGIKYAFPPEYGALTRGLPTSYAASPLKQKFLNFNESPPVWPDPEGDVRGYEFSPLYKSVPKAAKKDKALYELLALVDAIRDGRARERQFAIQEIQLRLAKQ